MIKREEPKRECRYYNWGGDLDKRYICYPREYGARCEFYDEFFTRDENGVLNPNCLACGVNLELIIIY